MRYFLVVAMMLVMSNLYAQNTPGNLKSNEVYVTDIAKTINNVNTQSVQMIKQSLKGENIKIPKGWRLVSVIPDSGTSGKKEYVLFFQDDKAGVHSLSIDSSGMVSGNNILHLLSTE